MAPQVSVIIPVGSVDAHLGEQLQALAGQTFDQTWELIVALNSPKPDQMRRLEVLLAKYGSLDSVIADASDQQGASYARNVGVKAARADWLAFCDGDDIADEAWLAELFKSMSEHKVVGGHLEESRLGIDGQSRWRPPATPGDLPKFLGHPYLVSANMGIRRDLFERAGGFKTDLTRCEDIAFSWEVIDLGVDLHYCAEAIVHYRHRKGLVPMMKQHYLYGIGFSELLNRRGVPGKKEASRGALLKANNQAVASKSMVHYLRRGSIAAGRIVGLGKEKLPL